MVRRGKYQARRGGNGSSLPGWAWLLIGAALALVVVMVVPNFKSGNDEPGFFRPRPNPDARPAISALDEAVPPRPRPAEAPERPLPAPLSEPDYDFYTLLPEQETTSDTGLAARETEGERGREQSETQARAEAVPARPVETQRDRPAEIQRERERSRSATIAREEQRLPPPPQKVASATVHPDAAIRAIPSASNTTRSTSTTASTSSSTTAAEIPSSSRYLLQAGTFSSPTEAESLKAQIALLGLQARVEAGTANGKPIHRVRLGPYTSSSELADIKQRLNNGGVPAQAVSIK